MAPNLNLTKVGRVVVTVADTDRAIDFYVDRLGFEKIVDVPMGDAGRWVEPGSGQTGICLDTSDVEADHTALKSAGVDVDDEISRFGDPVPPMFWLRDADKNSLLVVQPST